MESTEKIPWPKKNLLVPHDSYPVPHLSIGYIGLSPGPQDPKGPPKNCGTLRVNGRYIIILIKLRQKFVLIIIHEI